MANTPKIRFKGFLEDWEQRKFSDFTFSAGERNKNDFDLEPYAITNSQGFVAQSEAHDDFGYMKDVDRKMYIIVKPHSFAYNPARINVGSLGYYGGTENVIVSSLYEVFQTDEHTDDNFLKHWFKTKEFQDWIERLQEGSVRLYFYYDKLCECKMKMPSIEEQQKIGLFFSRLDTLVTLHQRKVNETKELKSFMLQKMFPKKGEKIPEIRFSGFTDIWEQRKLGDIANKVIEKNTGLLYIETFTNSAEFGVISQRDFFDRGISKMESLDGYYVVREEDFVYNPRVSATAPVGPINRNKLGRIGVMSPLYTVFRTHDVDTTYLEQFFKSVYWHSFMRFNGDSGARSDRFSIKDNLFFEMPVPYPDIVEQRKIGEWLTSLDDLIMLHQRKCDELKDIKKVMLKNMFI